MNTVMTKLEAWLPVLRTPGGERSLRLEGDELVADGGERFPVARGIPSLLDNVPTGEDARWNRLYDVFAPFYGVSERVAAQVLCGVNLRREQARMVSALAIARGSSVLEVSPGPGTYQPWLAQAVGPEGKLAAVDLSRGMLATCV